MPEDVRQALDRAREDQREGKAPTTQAGEFFRKDAFHISDDAEVVALLPIGCRKVPGRVYPGRHGMDQIVFYETYGRLWEVSASVTIRANEPGAWRCQRRAFPC
jgi:hypothetical protein